MFDVELFIECVQDKPVLWGGNAKKHSNKHCKEKSWVDIGEILYENWFVLESVEKDEKVKEMKEKWRNIRDRYIKFVNLGKRGDSVIKKKKYVYADALSFLQKTLDKKTTGNIEENTDEEKCQKRERSEEEDNDEGLATSVRSKIRRVVYRRHPKPDVTPFQNELLKKLADISKQEEDDPDKSFLVSLLPHYKQLNDVEKIDFGLMTLQFFQGIKQTKRLQNLPVFSSQQSTMNPSNNSQRCTTPMSNNDMQASSPAPTPSPEQGTSAQISSLVQVSLVESPLPVQDLVPVNPSEQQEQLEKMRSSLKEEVDFHKKQIKAHEDAVKRHEKRLKDLK